jgi:V/A-type H+-transporting ATPase subunit I
MRISPFLLPDKSLAGLIEEEKEVKYKLDQIENRINTFANRRPNLINDMTTVQDEINLEIARVSFEKVQLEAAADVPEEDTHFSYITGFVPAEDMGTLKRTAAEKGWALALEDPPADIQVPTKLKNNKFVELLYPLTDFLEMMPGYDEVDVSPWFLFFFTIFFGMIFGDAAYGIILFLIAVAAMIKTAKKGVPAGFKMMLLLSVSNIIWGVLTCSWFGMDHAILPQFLKDASLSYISEAKGTDGVVVAKNLQLFCFSLALVHLTIAHVIAIIRQIKAKSLLLCAEIGNLAMLWGMYNVVLYLVVDNARFPLLPASLYMLGGGFVLVFIFASYQGSVLQSVLSSVKNILAVVLGITNVFSDIMSYIRLWAVGLAGASIAGVVNTMAGPMLGSFLIFAGIILLGFGHGLNLVLNVLSVLVHGVRLNTLEFSGHVGLAWSGTPFLPFAEKVKRIK